MYAAVSTASPPPRLVDLSVPVDPRFWEPDPVNCQYIDHRRGADLLGQSLVYMKTRSRWRRMVSLLGHRLGFGINHKDFPDQKGLSLMRYTLTTHTGTHMDAPFHYGDRAADGGPARTICEVPLEWCYGDGVVLDVSQGDRQRPVSAGEVELALERLQYRLKPLDVVLLRTAGDQAIGERAYFNDFRGVSREATDLLVRAGIKVIGVDSFGFDPPFVKMLNDYTLTGDKQHLWPAHFYGRQREYCQLERLTNLDAIGRGHGFKVCCFPIRLSRADAAWCRVVAVVGENAN